MMMKNKYILEKVAIAIFLLIILLLCYFPIFSNGFLDSWDDQWMVKNVFTESGWSAGNLYAIFMHSYQGQYSPLVELNYVFLYSFFGYNPFWFHLASLVWHCGCVILIFFLVRQLLLLSGEGDVKVSQQVAFLVSLLFVIHPVNVESIAWISAVKVPMYTFFFLLSLLSYLYYIKFQRIVYYVIALFCFVCSGLSKEQAFVLPFTLLLIDWFTKRNQRTVEIWFEKLPFFILSVGLALLTLDLQGGRSDTVSYTVGQRVLFGCYSIFEYLTKSVLPVNLNYLYPFPVAEGSIGVPIRFYVYPILVVGLGYSLFYFRRNRILLFGSLFFILHLLLSLHIIPMPRHGIVADRYLYLSLIGLLMIIGYALVIWINSRRRRYLGALIILLYGLYLGIYTYQYSKKWENADMVKEYLRGFYKEDADIKR